MILRPLSPPSVQTGTALPPSRNVAAALRTLDNGHVHEVPSDLIDATLQWIEGDPDPETRLELEDLLERGDTEALAERMAGSLAFGTAGLRGRVEAGSNRMNRAVIIRTTRGLARYLLARDPDSEQPVVVGRDARLSSERFMEDTVGVLAAAGLPVRYFPEPVPTPLVAYASRMLDAQAAVVITASHNPRYDNGYKVYDANGAQIVPPVDGEIAAAIGAVGLAVDVPRVRSATRGGDAVASPVPPDVFDRYLDDVAAVRPRGAGGSDLVIVYTPMHGVGGVFVTEALRHFGHTRLHPVPRQYEPDGRFPTVEFPNPEEPGALDLATELAREVSADLIIANDPDTDRLAVSVEHADGWRPLTGNQVGVLLADFILETTVVPEPIVINSIVSSPMLARVAAAHHAGFAQTLTGFKWIWNAALDLQAAGEGRFVFGYEEALGYSVGPAVRDKDGISAAVLFADLAAACKAAGITLLDRLDALHQNHGLWVSVQRSVVRPGTEGAIEIAAAMDRLAASPSASLADLPVLGSTDYRRGAEARPRYLPAASLVELDLGERGRVLARPSGTEPKLKVYVDLTSPLAAGDEPSSVAADLEGTANRLAAETVEALGL